MGVDHCGLDIFVAEQFLDGTNIVASFKQMGGKRMAKGVWPDRFVGEAGQAGGVNGFLQVAFIEMVALLETSLWVTGAIFGRENTLRSARPIPWPRSGI